MLSIACKVHVQQKCWAMLRLGTARKLSLPVPRLLTLIGSHIE